jgi:peptide/nickel transport system substrate-binding protein
MMGGFVTVARMFAEPLFDNDANMEKVWMLATGIDEVSSEKWIIHLREGVTFSNGNPFTAADVMFTLNYLANDPMGFMYIPTFDLANSKIIDDYTIEIAIVGYQITQIDALTMLYIFDEESFDPDTYAMNPVGTGPYVVTEYVINSHVNMTANENYWGDVPKIKNLQFKVLNEDSQRINALEAGSVDVSAIPISDIEYIDSLPDFSLATVMSGLCDNVVFNLSENSVFQNLDARLAVSHAIDRDAIVRLVYEGHAKVTDYPVSMSAKDYEGRFAGMHEVYMT